MFLNITNTNGCDTLVTISDGHGQVTETFIMDGDHCLMEVATGDAPIDISFTDKPKVQNKFLLILIYILLYVFQLAARLLAGKHGDPVDFFQDTVLEGIHTQISSNYENTDPIEIIYKESLLMKNARCQIGRVLSPSNQIKVRYFIDPIVLNCSFRKWIRDTLLLLLPLYLVLIWVIIMLWSRGPSVIAVFFPIFCSAIFFALCRHFIKTKKTVDTFIKEWNTKEATN